MMVDQNILGVEVTKQASRETFSPQADVTETTRILETIGRTHRKKPQLRNVTALVLLLTAFCVVVTLVAHKALASKIKAAPKYPNIKDEEAQQKLHDLVDFMDSCRLPPRNRPKGKTVNLLYAGVRVTVEVVEVIHKNNWPPQEVVASARNEVEDAVEKVVSFLNEHETDGNRWEAFRISAEDPGSSGLLHFFITASK